MDLISFLLGMLFMAVAIPVLDKLTELICTFLYSITSFFGLQIVKLEAKATKLQHDTQCDCEQPVEEGVPAIGFQVMSDEMFEGYENDEEGE